MKIPMKYVTEALCKGGVISRFFSRLKDKAYEFRHGHPFLLSEEVDIICETRADSKFKHYNDYQIQSLIKRRVHDMYESYKYQQKCTHKKWNCDTQIKTIQCRECGKKAWIEDYITLY